MSSTSVTSEIDRLLAGYGRARQNLIPILQHVQDQLGYLSEEAIGRIAAFLDLSESDVFGVATFYTQFRFHSPAKHQIKVCRDSTCHVRGSGRIMEGISRMLGVAPGETTEDLEFSLESVACSGACALAPVVGIDARTHGRMTVKKMEKQIKELGD